MRTRIFHSAMLTVALAGCGKHDHHVQAHATAAEYPANCAFGGTFTVEGHPDVNIRGATSPWSSDDVRIAEGKAAAASFFVGSLQGAHDPACDVAVACELRVDGAVVASAHATQHVTCVTPVVSR